MIIGFFGASKAGISLAYYFLKKGIHVSGFYNRTYENAKKAANMTKTTAFDNIDAFLSASDVVILSIADSAIESISSSLPKETIKNKYVGHLSGALSTDAIATDCLGKFSLHPIQTLIGQSSDIEKLENAIFSYQGDEAGEKIVKNLLSKLGNRYFRIEKQNKIKYHLAATLSSNYVVSILNLSYNFYKDIGLDEDIILDIIKSIAYATLDNFLRNRLDSLTGPAARGDIKTLEKHLNCFCKDDKMIFLSLLKLTAKFLSEKGDIEKHNRLRDFIKNEGWD